MDSIAYPRTARPLIIGWRRAVSWPLQVGGAAMFAMAGLAKRSADSQMIALFETIGVGQWFRYTTGSIEVVGALLLLVPAAAGLGATLL